MMNDVAACDCCGSQLQPVFADLNRRRDDDQWHDCLHILLVGGYGEYVDNLFDAPPHYRLCRHCADALMGREPWIANLGHRPNGDNAIVATVVATPPTPSPSSTPTNQRD